MENDSNINAKNEMIAWKDGYDIPIYGLDNGTFYYLHIPAMICIALSFACASISIVLSFRHKGHKTFFKGWSKSERFVVYLALCDGLFNLSHFTDHLHIVIVKDMVRPKELCEFYGFNLAVFVNAQCLMVNIIAVNACLLIFFDKNLKFGRYDWKLLLWIFGAPFTGSLVCASLGQFGPSGAFCFFDGVKGSLGNLLYTTIPIIIVFLMNIILYILTWIRVHRQDKISRSLHSGVSASSRVAKSMSLFVFVYFVQWWPLFIFGVWGLVNDTVPQALMHCLVIFSNIGGILNLVVYSSIRNRQVLSKDGRKTPSDTVTAM